ncbi:MAG TPA: long-chain fatty acid--CoA ligase, partial [Treponema sp.]|nr:long-chain fatty acid--CoA ligase [Treponema sp.]
IENAFQLYYNDIEQLTVRGYVEAKDNNGEMIEALVYPADELYKKLNVMRGTNEAIDTIYQAVEEIVDKTNKTLQPYQRISRITILEEALEMTTTRKVKRNFDN